MRRKSRHSDSSTAPASLSLSSAHFWRILASALFLDRMRSASEYNGNTCLFPSLVTNQWSHKSRTDSTTPSTDRPHLSHPSHQATRGYYYKSVRNPWLDQYVKRLEWTSMQSGSMENVKHQKTTFMRAYLCSDVGQRRLRRRTHAVDTSISGARCLGFLVHRAWRRKNMLERLQTVSWYEMHEHRMRFYRYEEATAKETIPGIFSIIHIVGVQEDWPLIPGYLNLTIWKLGAGAGSNAHVNWATRFTKNNYLR